MVYDNSHAETEVYENWNVTITRREGFCEPFLTGREPLATPDITLIYGIERLRRNSHPSIRLSISIW